MIIFCHKCGKKLETQDEFCQSCGVKISINNDGKNLSSNKGLKRADLEKKTWYRALKVLYVGGIVIVVFGIAIISWSQRPLKLLDGYNSLIICDTGKSYVPEKNNINLYNWQTDLSYSNDEDARILCKYDTTNFYYHSSEFISKNYTFTPVYEKVEYNSWIGYTISAFFIFWILNYLIKIIFFYILLGDKPEIFYSYLR